MGSWECHGHSLGLFEAFWGCLTHGVAKSLQNTREADPSNPGAIYYLRHCGTQGLGDTPGEPSESRF
eukprot:5425396-Karenia_brevis.AAC.1